jgi:UDP-GlcNAc3NAcA epimerase
MTSIITIVGARPQFIKAAALSRAVREAGSRVQERILHTGQHFDHDMSDVFFRSLEIPEPTWNLGIGGGSHGCNTGRMIEAIENVLLEAKPDHVVVFGDTDSTLAGALAAVKLRLSVAHVEAGVRSYDRSMPEEINRVLTDHASSLLFAPTSTATVNLEREGIRGEHVRQVGDVMYDVVLHRARQASAMGTAGRSITMPAGDFILTTLHRPANVDDQFRLGALVAALGRSRLPVVWPVHPRTRVRLETCPVPVPANVMLVPPVDYDTMQTLQRSACLVVTDSGGVQKEACFNRVPCIVVRRETEWPELLHSGHSRLCDDVACFTPEPFPLPASDGATPFGRGDAAIRIVSALCV